MFSECANPNCATAFDFHQGRFYRFHKLLLDDDSPDKTLEVVHFWLCNRCANADFLAHLEGCGAAFQVPFEKTLCPDGECAGAVD